MIKPGTKTFIHIVILYGNGLQAYLIWQP